MRILVISDSHGRRSSLVEVVRIMNQPGAPDRIIHLGDMRSDATYLREHLSQPILSVPGNCDWATPEEEERVECIEGVRLFLCHGHTQHVKRTLLPLTCRARELEVQAALFGHTHSPFKEFDQGVLLLNPGALQDDKCALLTLENGEFNAQLLTLDALC